jgi:REP element-mobilizing transposase RayT
MAKHYNKQNGRKNMRLQGYDYSCAGLYFLTIVVQNRLHLFGNIKNGKMILNHAGCMIERWYHEIENKFPDKICHDMVVMPNHFHCIIENFEMADPNDHPNEKYGIQNQKYGVTIGRVMDWFKTMTTNAYISGVNKYDWQRFDGKLWQRNYYDHIIHNEPEYLRISEYIINNPIKWGNDKFYND